MDLNNIILENQKLIYSIANYFQGYPNKEDLFQVGCIGLMKAYEKYDDTRESKFTTYAYHYILGEMKRYVREDKGIKVSREMTRLYLKIEKARVLLAQRQMREPSAGELAEFLGMDEYTIADAIQSVHALTSMDEAISEDGKEITLHEVIADNVVDINTLLALKQELLALEPREQKLIQARYLDDLTQSETAEKLGISQVQVSRKEQKVLVKLRERLVS